MGGAHELSIHRYVRMLVLERARVKVLQNTLSDGDFRMAIHAALDSPRRYALLTMPLFRAYRLLIVLNMFNFASTSPLSSWVRFDDACGSCALSEPAVLVEGSLQCDQINND